MRGVKKWHPTERQVDPLKVKVNEHLKGQRVGGNAKVQAAVLKCDDSGQTLLCRYDAEARALFSLLRGHRGELIQQMVIISEVEKIRVFALSYFLN